MPQQGLPYLSVVRDQFSMVADEGEPVHVLSPLFSWDPPILPPARRHPDVEPANELRALLMDAWSAVYGIYNSACTDSNRLAAARLCSVQRLAW